MFVHRLLHLILAFLDHLDLHTINHNASRTSVVIVDEGARAEVTPRHSVDAFDPFDRCFPTNPEQDVTLTPHFEVSTSEKSAGLDTRLENKLDNAFAEMGKKLDSINKQINNLDKVNTEADEKMQRVVNRVERIRRKQEYHDSTIRRLAWSK